MIGERERRVSPASLTRSTTVAGGSVPSEAVEWTGGRRWRSAAVPRLRRGVGGLRRGEEGTELRVGERGERLFAPRARPSGVAREALFAGSGDAGEGDPRTRRAHTGCCARRGGPSTRRHRR